MSSISLNTASQSLYPLLNNTTNQNPLLAALAGSDPVAGTNGTLADGSTIGGPGIGPNSELFQQVQQTVTSALASIQGNSSANPNQVIEQAILQVFSQANSSAASATSPLDPDGDGDQTDGTNSATQSFLNTLQNYGIDSQQFHNDFLSALQQAQQTGQGDPTSVFASFPTGLSVDTAA